MITSFKISSLMGEQSIKLENGITLDRMHGTVLVGKVENGQLLWIENFDNLPEKGKDLLFKMLKARKVIMSNDGTIDYKGFWQDFSIADAFGLAAIQDTYNRAMEWKYNAEYITALVITLNHKIWYWYDEGNNEFSKLYDKLWRELDEWCLDNLKGKDLEYYLQTTD